MAHMKAVRLLSALDLMPLEEISEDAEQWRQDIREAIEELRGPIGLPANDPLRYDEDGALVSRERLERRLDIIIDSWPTFGLSEGALWRDRS
jgi:hypothetical protein|tara:strand:- start:1215 stop:1490 length:276 start_codon:yes stop_codon:yes gene_type:complete